MKLNMILFVTITKKSDKLRAKHVGKKLPRGTKVSGGGGTKKFGIGGQALNAS